MENFWQPLLPPHPFPLPWAGWALQEQSPCPTVDVHLTSVRPRLPGLPTSSGRWCTAGSDVRGQAPTPCSLARDWHALPVPALLLPACPLPIGLQPDPVHAVRPGDGPVGAVL